MQDPRQALLTIIASNTLVNVAYSSKNAIIFMKLAKLYNFSIASAISLSVTFTTITLLVFGEILPKMIAMNFAESLSKIIIVIIYPLNYFFNKILKLHPIVKKITDKIFSIFNIEISPEKANQITKEEFENFLEIIEEEKILSETEEELLKNAFQLTEFEVQDIMIPRTEMIAANNCITIRKALELMKKHQLKHLPIYIDTIDKIKGIVYYKDIFAFKFQNQKFLDYEVKNFIRKPLFVIENKPVLKLLEDFKKSKIHVAIVVDEYGGTEGIVTLQNIIDKLVGQLEQKTKISTLIIQKDKNLFICDARTPIEEFEEYFKVSIDYPGSFETIGGLFMAICNKIPNVGEEVKYKNFQFQVIEIEGHAIKKLMVKKL